MKKAARCRGMRRQGLHCACCAACSFELTRGRGLGGRPADLLGLPLPGFAPKQVASAADAESKERLEELRLHRAARTWRNRSSEYGHRLRRADAGATTSLQRWRGRHSRAGRALRADGRRMPRQLAKTDSDGDPDYEPDTGPEPRRARVARALGGVVRGQADVVGKFMMATRALRVGIDTMLGGGAVGHEREASSFRRLASPGSSVSIPDAPRCAPRCARAQPHIRPRPTTQTTAAPRVRRVGLRLGPRGQVDAAPAALRRRRPVPDLLPG